MSTLALLAGAGADGGGVGVGAGPVFVNAEPAMSTLSAWETQSEPPSLVAALFRKRTRSTESVSSCSDANAAENRRPPPSYWTPSAIVSCERTYVFGPVPSENSRTPDAPPPLSTTLWGPEPSMSTPSVA